MKRFTTVRLILSGAFAVWALSVLACGGPVSLGGPTPTYEPVPVSTEAVGSLSDKFGSLGAASGEVTVSITESELTSYLAEQLAEQPDTALSNPQVYLRDGKIQLYATVTTESFTANALVVMNASIVDNRLVVGIESADFGPVPAPQDLLDSLTDTVNEKLLSLFADLPTGAGIKSIAIADGNLTLTMVVK